MPAYFYYSELKFFSKNLGTVCNKYGKRFHQPFPNMTGNSCLLLKTKGLLFHKINKLQHKLNYMLLLIHY